MANLTRADLWSLEQYAEKRPAFRAEVMAHKKTREGFLGKLKENYRVWDKWLTSQTFCVGEEITICDFALFGVYARTLVLLPDTVQGLPNLKRWYNLMNLRSGVQKGQNFDQKV